MQFCLVGGKQKQGKQNTVDTTISHTHITHIAHITHNVRLEFSVLCFLPLVDTFPTIANQAPWAVIVSLPPSHSLFLSCLHSLHPGADTSFSFSPSPLLLHHWRLACQCSTILESTLLISQLHLERYVLPRRSGNTHWSLVTHSSTVNHNGLPTERKGNEFCAGDTKYQLQGWNAACKH